MRRCLAFLLALTLVFPAAASAPAGAKLDPARPDCGLSSGAECLAQAPQQPTDDGTREWMAVSTAFQAYDYAAALVALDALAAKLPFNADASFMRGYALARLNRGAEAIKAFDQAISLDSSHAMALAQRGLVRAETGQTVQGLADVDAALAIVAENPMALAYKGLILIGAGNDGEGLALLGQAADMAPDFVGLLLIKASALSRLKRTDLARADADKAVAIAPDDPSVYALRGRLLLNAGDVKGALADAEKGLSMGGQDPAFLIVRAGARDALGDPQGAATDRALVLKQHPGLDLDAPQVLPSLFGDGPGDPLPRLMLAVLRIERGDPKGARAIAEQVLVTTPWARPAVLMVRAYASQALGDHKLALADLDELESVIGKTAESQYIRAKVLWASGQRGEAMTNIEAAVRASSDDPLYLQTRATFRYESGDLAGALPDFQALRGSEDYGDWAWEMQILTLYFLDRNREAAEAALPYLREDKPTDDTLLRAVADTVWRLQSGVDWALADDLLAAADAPAQGEDFDLFLKGRSLMHAGNTDEAQALVARIGAHDVLRLVLSDAVYAPVWNTPALRAASDPASMYRRSFKAAWENHRKEPESLLAAVYALGVLREMGCDAAAAAAARRIIPSLAHYAEYEQFGASVFDVAAAEAVARGDGDAALATWQDGIERLGADNPYTLALILNAAFLMTGNGRYQDALDRLARVEQISPSYDYAIVMAQYIQALAYDGLGRRKERDTALDYTATHAAGNAMAAILASGMLRSYDEAARILLDNLKDNARAHLILGDLHARPHPAAASDLERRERTLLDRLRADPRVVAALAPVGRILTLPDNKTCPLSPEELAEHPFRYPFESTPAPQPSSGQ